MKLTTKGRFAVAAMADLAFQYDLKPEHPVALAGVSHRQNISLSYLEQLFGMLRRVGLIESTRGPGGGYSLARPPETITVADIVKAVDESIDATQCAGDQNCLGQRGECIAHYVWVGLNEVVSGYLNSINLRALINWQKDRVGQDVFLSLPKTAIAPLPESSGINEAKTAPNFIFSLAATKVKESANPILSADDNLNPLTKHKNDRKKDALKSKSKKTTTT